MNKQTNVINPLTLYMAHLLPESLMCGHHVYRALLERAHWLYRTFAHIPQRLIDFLLRSC